MKNLEDWLHQEIEKRNWSVREFGRRIEVSPSHAARIANGEVMPSIEICEKIARVFNVSLEHIFRLAGILPPLASPIAEEREIVHILRNLPKGKRRDILQYARFRQRSGGNRESTVSTGKAKAKSTPAIPPQSANQQPMSVRSMLESVAMRAIDEISDEGEEALVNTLLEVIKYREELKNEQLQDSQDENKEQ
jgi:transcriptional regulator with XRE-family HTH domain